jgi:hypothetical protein
MRWLAGYFLSMSARWMTAIPLYISPATSALRLSRLSAVQGVHGVSPCARFAALLCFPWPALSMLEAIVMTQASFEAVTMGISGFGSYDKC